jgi:multidrug resistance efflux pump
LPFIKNKLNNTEEYFGIAENQIRNINLEYPVEILKIYKLQGESVKTGDTLMKLRRVDLEAKKQSLEFDKLQNYKKILADEEEYLSTQKLLLNKRNEIVKDYQLKYGEFERATLYQTNLLTQVIGKQDSSRGKESRTAIINDIKTKENLELADIDLRIKNSKNEFYSRQAESQVKSNKLVHEIELLTRSEQSLDLICPEDGIIGQLEFSPGDKIQAYTSLIKIYGTHPNTVTIYIGDNQLSTLKVGDTVKINSINNKEYWLHGVVNALGTRVTALPERLKKIPDLRAWGREIQIRIPSMNEFMQGEKVLVRI